MAKTPNIIQNSQNGFQTQKMKNEVGQESYKKKEIKMKDKKKNYFDGSTS